MSDSITINVNELPKLTSIELPVFLKSLLEKPKSVDDTINQPADEHKQLFDLFGGFDNLQRHLSSNSMYLPFYLHKSSIVDNEACDPIRNFISGNLVKSSNIAIKVITRRKKSHVNNTNLNDDKSADPIIHKIEPIGLITNTYQFHSPVDFIFMPSSTHSKFEDIKENKVITSFIYLNLKVNAFIFI